MKVIKHGMFHKDREVVVSCPRCGCVFSTFLKELNYVQFANDFRGRCPECDSVVIVNGKGYSKHK